MGGGRENVASLLETIAHIESVTNKKLRLSFEDWRPGDNKRYCTDYSKVKKLLGWEPEVNWKEGIRRTLDWVQTSTQQISSVMS